MYRLSYCHNDCDNNHSWEHGSKVSVKTFANENDSYKWIKENPQYTPLKLGAWDDDIKCYRIIKDFREEVDRHDSCGKKSYVQK